MISPMQAILIDLTFSTNIAYYYGKSNIMRQKMATRPVGSARLQHEDNGGDEMIGAVSKCAMPGKRYKLPADADRREQ